MSRKQLLYLGMGIAVCLVLVWGVLSALHGFSAYKQSILSPSDLELSIELVAPTADQIGTVGTPVHLIASAYGSYPIESIVFWIDSVPVGVKPAAGEDPLAATAIFPWIPTEPGSYAIFARVRAVGGLSADSDVLVFEVLPGSKTVDPQPLVADPAYEPPASNDGGSGQAQGFSGSIGGWLSPSNDASLPAAPGLDASVNGCEVTLQIYDNSADETGFRVYRSLPNIPGWSLVDILAANDDLAALTYAAGGYYGTIGYKVAAFNAQGEAVSNPLTVEVDPSDCPSADLPFVSLQVVELQPLVPLDRAYCYFSPDGNNWMRWPQEGFLPVGEDGFDLSNTDLFSVLEGSQVELLLLDCWGWLGGELLDLGQFSVDGLAGAGLNQVPFGNDSIQGLLGFGQVSTMEGILFKGDYSLFLPIPDVSGSTSPDDCLAKLDPAANVPPDYCLKADGEIIWPFTHSYITWDLTNNCSFSPACIDFFDQVMMAQPDLVGSQVGYRVYSMNPNSLVRTFNSPSHMVYTVPGTAGSHLNCDYREAEYRVSSYLIPQGSQQVFESESYWFSVPVPCPQVSGAQIQVTPQFLVADLGPEEENEGSLLDLYGFVFISTGFFNDLRIIQFGAFGDQIKAGCPMPDSVDELGGAAFNGKCPISNGLGVDFNQAYICPDGSALGCASSFSLGGNITEMTILEGELLTVELYVYDYDQFSADDLVCSGLFTIPAWFEDDWQAMVNGMTLQLSAFNEDNACLMEFSVEELLQFSAN